MKINPKVVLFHFFGWAIFLLLPLLLFPYPNSRHVISSPGFLTNYALTSAILMAFFYFNFSFAISYFLLRRKMFLFALVNLGAFFMVVVFVKLFSIENMTVTWAAAPEKTPGVVATFLIPPGVTYLRMLILFAISIGIKLYTRWKETEIEKTNAELAFLKAQINPHFLFNTLNGIYALSIKKSDKTPDAISRLSSIMRYVISEAHHDKVPLDMEISQLHNFIELQKLRLTESTPVFFEVEGDTSGLEIVPLILMTFIENAFKHGVSTEEESPIRIHIKMEDFKLRFHVRNKKPQIRSGNHDTGGIGLENTRMRLTQIYGGRHDLIMRNGANDFLVDLVIQLK